MKLCVPSIDKSYTCCASSLLIVRIFSQAMPEIFLSSELLFIFEVASLRLENKATFLGVVVFAIVAGLLNFGLNVGLLLSVLIALIPSLIIGLYVYSRGD